MAGARRTARRSEAGRHALSGPRAGSPRGDRQTGGCRRLLPALDIRGRWFRPLRWRRIAAPPSHRRGGPTAEPGLRDRLAAQRELGALEADVGGSLRLRRGAPPHSRTWRDAGFARPASTSASHWAIGRGSASGTWTGRGSGDACESADPAHSMCAPAVPRVQIRVRRGPPGRTSGLGGRQSPPARGSVSGLRCPVHSRSRAATRAPPRAVQCQTVIDGQLTDEGEVDVRRGRGSSAAAAPRRNVSPSLGILQLPRVHGDRGVASDHRTPPLELVHGEVDAVATQDAEGGLHAILGDQLVQVPVLTASGGQELPIGAGGMARRCSSRTSVRKSAPRSSRRRRRRRQGISGESADVGEILGGARGTWCRGGYRRPRRYAACRSPISSSWTRGTGCPLRWGWHREYWPRRWAGYHPSRGWLDRRRIRRDGREGFA